LHLAGEPRVPEGGEDLLGGLLPHVLDDRGDRDGLRVREAAGDQARSEPVIAVARG